VTKVDLLEVLSVATREVTADIIMPVRRQKEDKTEPEPRAAGIHKMRLPDSSAAQKKAPYIIHQIITGRDTQTSGKPVSASVTVRSIFCVYNDNEEEGGLMLLNLMERLRIALLERVVIGDRFQLDLEAGLECLIYPDDTAPYYAGEMSSTWILPAVRREVKNIWQ